ncbi:MAG: alpha-L-rhamnosidase N-terminal domain-containing protein, partial [Bacteroidales bacterium]|nr:alpha-L-rhamnosidase N-terminal domain-containing protein [Bacteroidales bacterium]
MRETKQKARSFSRKNIALWVLAVLLCSAVAVQGQPFFGCRSGNQWAETPMLRKSLVLSNEHWHPNHDSVFFFLDVASLGYHEVYVNGTRVGNEVMHPAVSQLNKRAMLVRYSIGDYLHVGTNEIMLWLGQGWGRVYGTPAAATAKLYRVVSDGDRALEYLVCQT